jgi:hypothetical protein
MILGFEEQTHNLTDYEKDVVLPAIVSFLRDKKGKERAVKNEEISYTLSSTIKPARIRKILHVIRVSGELPGIVASSKGYYIADTEEEWEAYLYGLHQRIRHITELEAALENQFTEWKNAKQIVASL